MRLALLFLLVILMPPVADDSGWVELGGTNGLKAWKSPTGQWAEAATVKVDPADPKHLSFEGGSGILVNGKLGRTTNLVTKDSFGDIEFHADFLIPKGSNAGVKFEGLYEVQILDSYGVKEPKASDCGGIYPRAELLPKYHYLDKGYPPKVIAAKPPGEWQTLDVVFHAPRFDDKGMKIENAKFVKVLLNGQVVQEDLSVSTPTGHAYKTREIPTGPILLQADHGPVAFRSVKVRAINTERK
jgi:hypothetical protein